MTRSTAAILGIGVLSLLTPLAIHAQGANALSANARVQFSAITGFVARSAEQIPENLYSFRPTPEVRTIGQLFGHIADAYFSMCSTAAGAPPPRTGIENTVSTKADLMSALSDGIAYCVSVMQGMNDQRGAEPVPFAFGPTPRLGVLFFVTTHTYEHYGNLVTYMRLNGMVPPSSQTPATTPPC
jgi:uncharacterized damage-inducible protein DinB